MREELSILPVFLPNRGCPLRCVFCDQSITAGSAPTWLTPLTLPDWVEACCMQSCQDPNSPPPPRRELALFGATFTGMPLADQQAWLDAAAVLKERELIESVRVSTRPDHMDADTVTRLRQQGVTTVELGVQSLSTPVLHLCRREYDETVVEQAFVRLHNAGMRVVAQLMPFLPGAMPEDDIYSVTRLAYWKPDALRLFPTLVLRGTTLEEWYHQGAYVAAGIGEAAARCAEMMYIALNHGVSVLRVGMQDSVSLRSSLVAGPHHPAFGELAWACLAATLLHRVVLSLAKPSLPTFTVSTRSASLMLGHAGFGKRRLESLLAQCVSLQHMGELDVEACASAEFADTGLLEQELTRLGPLAVFGDSQHVHLRFSP